MLIEIEALTTKKRKQFRAINHIRKKTGSKAIIRRIILTTKLKTKATEMTKKKKQKQNTRTRIKKMTTNKIITNQKTSQQR